MEFFLGLKKIGGGIWFGTRPTETDDPFGTIQVKLGHFKT
jgi:hypothetical protein